MPDLEAIGDAVTGAALARAVEPGAGEADGHTHERNCLNCGCALTGDYCHCCGQKAHVHRTLGAFWHDLLHSVLHFEGKIWRTLPLLAWRPGDLTRRYVEGERARFVSPMALFLFSVFLMFIVFTTLGGPFRIQSVTEDQLGSAQEYRQDRARVLADIRDLEAERRQRLEAGESTTEVDIELRVERQALALVDRLRQDELAREKAEIQREKGPAADGPQVIAAGSTPQGTKGRLTIGRTGVASIDAALAKAEANPELLLYKLQNNAYKFSWLLIPLSVPFVWLLFLHRRRYRQFRAYDHTVFVTYSIAFMTLGLVALTFLRLVGISEAIIGLLLVFVPPLHMFRQLRGAYSLSRWSALWRTLALIVFAAMATSLFLGILVLIGVIG
jgi:hypothetical protein